MKKQSTEIITGIVDLWGPGGGQWQDTKKWEFSFSFSHWKIGDGEIQTAELPVSRVVSEREQDRLMDEISSLDVICIEAVRGGDGQAELIKLLQTGIKDKEFAALVKEIKKPVIVKHKYLGALTLDKMTKTLETTIRFYKTKITLSIEADSQASYDRSLEYAVELYKKAEYWENQAKQCAVRDLLELKNDNWLEEEEQELNEAQFQKKMKPDQLTLYPDGNFDLDFDDGELFWGHTITVHGNISQGCLSAEI